MVRRLPWHLWNFFDHYPQAEMALSATDYQVKTQSVTTPGKVRILVILGNSTGINIDADRELLKSVKGAELVFLEQPQRQELDRHLWDKRGWDILLFAGHSQTEGETGQIYINPTESLTIPQLKNALQKAIARGLQLAIFNSCDGLGLARKLEQLHIPQIIVMGEPVPDRVAQEFLKYLLPEFAGGKSLYQAVREARERLQGLENQFPCASWLPIICQNPTVIPPTWQQLRGSERQIFFTSFITSAIVTMLLIGMRSLGVFQLWELQTFDQLIRLRPDEGRDPRLLVVEVTEADLNKYGFPLSDGILAQAIAKLESHQPRSIALDIYRHLPREPGQAELTKHFQQNQRIIAICMTSQANNPNYPGFSPPANFPRQRLGFSDIVTDTHDDVVRRHLMFSQPDINDPCATEYALSVTVAFHYLVPAGIKPQNTHEEYIEWGNTIFKPLPANTGVYPNLDDRGFQIMLNYRSTEDVAQRIRLVELLEGKFNSDWVKNRIVFIGVTAPTGKDYHGTPYSPSQKVYTKMPGVILQAHMVSQILSAVLDRRPLLSLGSWWADMVWVGVASVVGGIISWRWQQLLIWGLITGVSIGTLYLISLGLLIQGMLIPIVPASLGLLITSAITYLLFSKKT